MFVDLSPVFGGDGVVVGSGPEFLGLKDRHVVVLMFVNERWRKNLRYFI